MTVPAPVVTMIFQLPGVAEVRLISAEILLLEPVTPDATMSGSPALCKIIDAPDRLAPFTVIAPLPFPAVPFVGLTELILGHEAFVVRTTFNEGVVLGSTE